MSNANVYPDTGGPVEVPEPEIPSLPMVRTATGLQVVNWDQLLPQTAALGPATALVQHEVQALVARGEAHDQVRADRVVRASGMILERVEAGTLATMADVACAIDFVADNNPKLHRVGELFDEGYTMTEVAYIYDARETTGLSLGAAAELFKALDLDLADPTAHDMISDAVDNVIARRGLDPRFRDIAAKVIIEMIGEGRLLSDLF